MPSPLGVERVSGPERGQLRLVKAERVTETAAGRSGGQCSARKLKLELSKCMPPLLHLIPPELQGACLALHPWAPSCNGKPLHGQGCGGGSKGVGALHRPQHRDIDNQRECFRFMVAEVRLGE